MRDEQFRRLKRVDALHKILRVFPALTWLLRLVSGALYRGLELVLGQRHPHVRVERQAAALAATTTPSGRARGAAGIETTGIERPRVLFFTKRGWFAHVTTEAILAKALELRGVDVRFFLCGGLLPQCDFKPATDPHVTRPLCSRCTGFGTRLLDSTELPVTYLDDLVSPARRSELASAVGQLDRQALLDYEVDGDPLGEWVRPSVNRSLLRGDVGEDEWSYKVLRGYVQSARIIREAADALLDALSPEIVVCTNGLFFAERIMLERARERDAEVITYERGELANTIVIDRNRPVVPHTTDTIWDRWKDQPLEDEQHQRLDEYLDSRARGNVGRQDLWPEMQRDGETILSRLGFDQDRPVITVYTNVMWDTGVFERNRAFEGQVDWMLETVELARELPNAQFVIRVHPAEIRLPMLESRDRMADRLDSVATRLPPNVAVLDPDDPASSYALLSASSCVLVYTSTVGLEAAVRGKPVVVGGLTHYRGKGFTIDVARRRDYASEIRAAWTRGRMSDEQVDLARRYAYTFFYRYQRPFPWVEDTDRASRSLNVSGLEDLAPGADPELDELCRWILEGGDLAAPGESAR